MQSNPPDTMFSERSRPPTEVCYREVDGMLSTLAFFVPLQPASLPAWLAQRHRCKSTLGAGQLPLLLACRPTGGGGGWQQKQRPPPEGRRLLVRYDGLRCRTQAMASP